MASTTQQAPVGAVPARRRVASSERLLGAGSSRWLGPLLGVLAGSLLALALAVAGGHGPTGVDGGVDRWLASTLSGLHGFARAGTNLGSPVATVLICAALALICLYRNARVAAALSVLSPPLAGVVAHWMLKPLVDRHLGSYQAFPSGHTTGAFTSATLAAVLLRSHGVLGSRLRRETAIALVALGFLVACFVGVALVAVHFHYATDVLGGLSVGAGTVLGVAGLLDWQLGGAHRPAGQPWLARSSRFHESE